MHTHTYTHACAHTHTHTHIARKHYAKPVQNALGQPFFWHAPVFAFPVVHTHSHKRTHIRTLTRTYTHTRTLTFTHVHTPSECAWATFLLARACFRIPGHRRSLNRLRHFCARRKYCVLHFFFFIVVFSACSVIVGLSIDYDIFVLDVVEKQIVLYILAFNRCV